MGISQSTLCIYDAEIAQGYLGGSSSRRVYWRIQSYQALHRSHDGRGNGSELYNDQDIHEVSKLRAVKEE